MKTKHIVIDARIRRSSTGRYVDRLLEHLQSIDEAHKYTVLVEAGDEWKPKNKRFIPLVCKYKRFSFNPIQQVRFSWQLYKLKPNLVHFAMTGHQPLFYFGKQVTTTHDLTMFKFTRRGRLPRWVHWLRMKGYRLLMWQSHRKARKIFVPTEYVRDAVAKFHLFTNRRLVITLEASEPPLSENEQKPNYSTQDFIMYVGSAFPHKNLRRLIKAYGIVKEQFPTLKLFIVGKKEYHAKKLERWEQKLKDNRGVVFTGFVPDAELKWLYTHASAYVFPSLSEGFGLPPLEAMTHGCPVVSSDSTCLPEVSGDAAHYFDPEDIEDIAEKIADVIGDEKLREKLIAKGYEQVKKYSWKRMAEQTLAVYNEVL